MERLIEAVPNFSEGRDSTKIDRIVNAIADTPAVYVLHIDTGYDANRTVITFVGPPEQVVEALFMAFKVAQSEIDMFAQSGAHPRMGAVDVCPLVPLLGVTMQECVEFARQLGARVGRELQIPIIHYELAATAAHRRLLADVRRGEFENWRDKIQHTLWQPDYGPNVVSSAGVSAIGVRPFLGAYNVNLNTEEVDIAKTIARNVRESGYTRTVNGQKERVKGELPFIRAIGWYMLEFKCAQVSMNLTRLDITGFHAAYTAVDTQAKQLGYAAAGSELIGLAPKRALLSVAQSIAAAGSEHEQLQAAADFLGLSSVRPFTLENQVLEYRLAAVSGLEVPTLPILPPEL